MATGPKKTEVKDEPGADQRFGRILKAALNTPPKHKQATQTPTKKGESNRKPR
jgi:hypothetical protein